MKQSAILGVLALLVEASPAFAQANAWQRKWYWGGQGGAFVFKTPTATGLKVGYTAGGHWLITAKRSAFYFAFDQIIFPTGSTSSVVDASALATGGIRAVSFTSGRRIQATLLAIPSDSKLQIFGGGGFAVHQITNAAAQGPFASVSEASTAASAVAEVDTKAFLVIAGGFQYRLGRWAVFANYNFMPGSKSFILSADQQAITGGIRYAVTSAHEDVATER